MMPSQYAYDNFMTIPYVWSGKTPDQGFDCSGMVSEALKATGHLPNKSLRNAQMLYDYLLPKGISSRVTKNSILFFGKSTKKITHIALAWNDWQMIEAGGEGRKPSDLGSVRMRPISMRGDLVAVINLAFSDSNHL